MENTAKTEQVRLREDVAGDFKFFDPGVQLDLFLNIILYQMLTARGVKSFLTHTLKPTLKPPWVFSNHLREVMKCLHVVLK